MLLFTIFIILFILVDIFLIWQQNGALAYVTGRESSEQYKSRLSIYEISQYINNNLVGQGEPLKILFLSDGRSAFIKNNDKIVVEDYYLEKWHYFLSQAKNTDELKNILKEASYTHLLFSSARASSFADKLLLHSYHYGDEKVRQEGLDVMVNDVLQLKLFCDNELQLMYCSQGVSKHCDGEFYLYSL